MKITSTVSIGIAALTSLQLLHANPADPTVIAGDVNFDTSGNTLTVSSDSTRSIVDWDSFSIGLTETTTFELPSASSAILNRVTGESVSMILGNMDCNGSLFLLNPNGIVFGANSVISTASFLAASMTMDDNDAFLNDTAMTFTSDDDTNINITALGEITASTGDVVLIGYRVEHYSNTSAPNGFVALGAGVETTFRSWDDPRIAVAPGSPGTPGDTGIGLAGSIEINVNVDVAHDGGDTFAAAQP